MSEDSESSTVLSISCQSAHMAAMIGQILSLRAYAFTVSVQCSVHVCTCWEDAGMGRGHGTLMDSFWLDLVRGQERCSDDRQGEVMVWIL